MAPRAKVAEVPPKINKLVAQYVALRDRISEIKEAQKLELEKFEMAKSKLAGLMIQFLKDTGQEAARTDEGTVYIINKATASLKDPDAFMDYVRENDAYELMDRRANSVACREFQAENGSLPPGVHINSIETIGVRST